MTCIDKEKLGYGIPDSKIKKGATGWFGNNINSLLDAIKGDVRNSTVYGKLERDPVLGGYNVNGVWYQFFYVDDYNYRSLNAHELVDLVRSGTQIYRLKTEYGKCEGGVYTMLSVRVTAKNIHVDIGDNAKYTPAELARKFAMLDGQLLTKKKEQS